MSTKHTPYARIAEDYERIEADNARLRAQNAALLEVLEWAIGLIEPYRAHWEEGLGSASDDFSQMYGQARAALRQAKGEDDV